MRKTLIGLLGLKGFWKWACRQLDKGEIDLVPKRSKWRCDACGEAENCDAACVVTTAFNVEPGACPVTGDECEWDRTQKGGD